MDNAALDKLRYPIGKFTPPVDYTPASRTKAIGRLKELPYLLRQTSYNLTDDQLDKPYRAGGWTSRQIIHHLADSHINSFTRFKLSLTEDCPTIKAYDQQAWVKGSDASLPISSSLNILDGVHQRLVNVLENMTHEDFKRTFRHPEQGDKKLGLDWMLSLYAWHGHHHLHQIKELKTREKWV